MAGSGLRNCRRVIAEPTEKLIVADIYHLYYHAIIFERIS